MKGLTKTPSVTKTISVDFWYNNFNESNVEFVVNIEVTYHWKLSVEPYPILDNLKIDGIEIPFINSFPKLELILSEDIVKEVLDKLEIVNTEACCEYLPEHTYKEFNIYNGYFIHHYNEDLGFIPVEGNDVLMDEINEM